MSEAALGVGAVGVLVGYLCMYFVSRFKTYTVKQFSGILAALFLGAAVTFIANYTADEPGLIWNYPIGLLIGVLAWGIAKRTGILPARVLGVQD